MSKRIQNNSNQVQIVNREYGITLQVLDGEVSALFIQDDPGKNSKTDIWADNEEFINVLYKIFKKAEQLGFFRDAQKVKDVDGEEYFEIEV